MLDRRSRSEEKMQDILDGGALRMPATVTPEQQLSSFLDKFTPEVAALAREIRAMMRKRLPSALELIYDNYNALAIGFGPTERASDAIFSIAVFPRWVNFFFLRGKGLPDPERKLSGNGKVARHIRVTSVEILDEPAVQTLIDEALIRAEPPLDPEGKHRLIIKSIAAKQRPRRPKVMSKSRKDRAVPTSPQARSRQEAL